MLIIVLNCLVTYLYEKIGIWYITIWWRKRIEKKKDSLIRKSLDESMWRHQVGGTTRNNERHSESFKYNSQFGNEGLR